MQREFLLLIYFSLSIELSFILFHNFVTLQIKFSFLKSGNFNEYINDTQLNDSTVYSEVVAICGYTEDGESSKIKRKHWIDWRVWMIYDRIRKHSREIFLPKNTKNSQGHFKTKVMVDKENPRTVAFSTHLNNMPIDFFILLFFCRGLQTLKPLTLT